jgi:hypothetical protein
VIGLASFVTASDRESRALNATCTPLLQKMDCLLVASLAAQRQAGWLPRLLGVLQEWQMHEPMQ